MKSVQIAALVWLSSLGGLSTASLAAPAAPTTKRILMLHQQVVGFSPVRDRFDTAFIDAVRSAESAQIEIYQETVETRFPAADQVQLLRDFLANKYAGRKIDVIVTVGVMSLALARQVREMIGNPAIVATLSEAGQIDSNDNVTGLQGGFFINGTIDLALTLQPDTQSVLVIDGSFEDSAVLQTDVEQQVKARSRPVGLVYLRNLPLSDVVSRVSAAPEHSVVLFMKQSLRTRTQPASPFETVAEVARASHVPVFSQVEEYVGLGILGGCVWDFEVDARRMADMAVRLATGASVRDVPSGRNTYKTVLDWRQLQRWGIPASNVPAGSVVRFRPQSIFELYQRYVVGGLIVFAAQAALIVGLLIQRVRRRRAEEQTRRSEERYRNVVDTQSDLICRFLPDTTLTFVNDAYCRFWNRTRDELLGTKFIELIPPSARSGVLARIRWLESGIDTHEHPVTLPDGTVGWHHWINHAIVDDRGRLVEIQGVGRDITDRKWAEDALGQAETRNSAMLRAIPDLMFVLLRDGTYVDYHTRDPKLLFVPPSAFIGKTIRDIMPPQLADLLMDALERASLSDDTIVVEYELPMGQTRHFEARLVRAGPERVLSIVRDVTESKRAAELNHDLAGRLIASQEVERQRIARELHDDLSQKIALLNIEIDQVAGQVTAGEPRSRLLRISAQAGEIASDVHDLSHELHPSKLQTLGLVAAVQSLCRDISQHTGIHVDFANGDLPPHVDPSVSLCLYRITQEALHNVARHSQASRADVWLTREGGHLYLRIADSGIGFDPQEGQPSGLGLVSMRERVASLRGELAIHASPGAGTCLSARVPLTPQVTESAPHISKSA